MLTIVWGLGWVVTSIERTAYPRFKRLITAHELHLFFSPTRDELQWASGATDCDEHLLALLLTLKSYQRMGCFPKLEVVPDMVVDFVRPQVELPEGTLPVYQAEKTAKNHRGLVRKRVGVLYDQVEARRIAERSIRKEAAAKNRPADLINIALEKVVESGLELPAFSTFDAMASKIRREVNTAICDGIHDRISPAERAGLARLLEDRDGDGTTLFNRLKRPAQGPSWSHFKDLTKRLEWVDGLGDTDVWMDGVAAGKATDFAGEADAADVAELGGFDKQYEQIEKVSAHHGNFWEPLLYGQIGRDRAVMFDLAEKLEFTATSEDGRVLDALAHAQRHQAARGEYITAFDEMGRGVDISFATQNWRKAVLDKTRPGQFVRKHFEAMVFTALAEELRTGDVAVVGSEEYADWSKQLLAWEAVQEKLGAYLVEVGLAEEGETPSSTPRSSAGSWRTSFGTPPRRRTPGTRTTRAWSSTWRRVSRR